MAYHEVVAEEFEGALSWFHQVGAAFDCVDGYFFHFGLDFFEEGVFSCKRFQVGRELLLGPHVALDFRLVELARVLGHGVVCEMSESSYIYISNKYLLVFEIVQLEVLGGKSDVAFVEEPDLERVQILDEDPLPDIELPVFDNQRVLDVLLDHIGFGLSDDVVEDQV